MLLNVNGNTWRVTFLTPLLVPAIEAGGALNERISILCFKKED